MMISQMDHNYTEEQYELKKLINACDMLEMSHKKICSEYERIRKNWEGHSAEKFISKLEIFKEHMEKNARDIEQVMNELKKISQIVFDAEKANTRIAAEGRGDK